MRLGVLLLVAGEVGRLARGARAPSPEKRQGGGVHKRILYMTQPIIMVGMAWNLGRTPQMIHDDPKQGVAQTYQHLTKACGRWPGSTDQRAREDPHTAVELGIKQSPSATPHASTC